MTADHKSPEKQAPTPEISDKSQEVGGPSRLLAEETKSVARLKQLIDTTQDAVLFIDAKGNIVLANPATYRIFGYEDGELLGRDVRILMSEPYASNHQKYVERYEQTGEKRAIGRIRQVSARRKNGQEFPIELSVTQLAEEGDGARYGAFIRDISENVRLQGELMERERIATVGTTASMLVHEIGNPLNNMSLQLEVMRRKVMRRDSAEETVEKVDACLREIQRLNRLVQEFRALSGRRRIMRRVVQFTPLVESTLANVTRFGVDIVVVRDFQDEGADVLADPDKMQQVILNLCHNALEAMPDGGILTLRTLRDGNDYVLEVIDTGIGVPEDIDIFEPFITSKSDGTGLGLAICSEIMRDHNGGLTYDSTPGAGTTFRVRLPLATSREAVRVEAGSTENQNQQN